MQTFDDTIEIDAPVTADDASAAPEPAASASEESGGKKNKSGAAIAGIVLLLCVAGAVTVAGFASGSKENATVRSKAMTDPEGNDAQTKAAIAMIQAGAQPSGSSAGVETSPAPPVEATADTAATVADPAGYAGTVTDTTPAAPPAAPAPAPADEEREPEPKASRPNQQRSIRLGPVADPRARPSDPSLVPAAYAARAGAGAPVKPPFNTVLPVRTLGTILTVKSGGLARFELTRDVTGHGWALRKGTQLVGVVRGGEADRAFISLIGFIDPASNKLVKLGGDLLSGDGGSGLKGKRKRVGSGWARALGGFARGASRVVNGAAQVAIGNAIGGGGMRPVIISDAYGGGAVTLPYDLSGTARDGHYIEVKAGTTAYVLVTDLPDTIKGVDAVTEMPVEQIAEYADVSKPERALGISEEELSRLMSDGTPEEIRAALPRMTPDMRRIAEQVIAQGGR